MDKQLFLKINYINKKLKKNNSEKSYNLKKTLLQISKYYIYNLIFICKYYFIYYLSIFIKETCFKPNLLCIGFHLEKTQDVYKQGNI